MIHRTFFTTQIFIANCHLVQHVLVLVTAVIRCYKLKKKT
jgi:hypothetical protein